MYQERHDALLGIVGSCIEDESQAHLDVQARERASRTAELSGPTACSSAMMSRCPFD